MFKKQMLLAMIFITGYAINSACEERVKNEQKDGTAFRINIYDSSHEKDLSKDIPSTTEINGVNIWDWLSSSYKIEMQGDSDIVECDDKSGQLNPRGKLSKFDVHELRRCFGAVAPMGYFWNENRDDYDAEHLKFIEALKQRTCVLCTEFGNTIVTNVQELDPQQVCKRLGKKQFDIEKYRCNLYKSDRQWREEAAQKKREQTAKKK
jgi:hypothetical protein